MNNMDYVTVDVTYNAAQYRCYMRRRAHMYYLEVCEHYKLPSLARVAVQTSDFVIDITNDKFIKHRRPLTDLVEHWFKRETHVTPLDVSPNH